MLLHAAHTDSAPIQRPSYLEHSALRRHLVIDSRPETVLPEPATRSSSASLSLVSDSDEDPREARCTPTPEPRSEPSGVIRVPTRWNAADKHNALVLSADGREVRYPSEQLCVLYFYNAHCVTAPTQSTDKEAAAIRANHPMPAACGVYYFEVEIIEKGTQGYVFGMSG